MSLRFAFKHVAYAKLSVGVVNLVCTLLFLWRLHQLQHSPGISKFSVVGKPLASIVPYSHSSNNAPQNNRAIKVTAVLEIFANLIPSFAATIYNTVGNNRDSLIYRYRRPNVSGGG